MNSEHCPDIRERRRFLTAAAGALTTMQLARSQSARAGLDLDASMKLAQSVNSGSSPQLTQIEAGLLNIGYLEAGPIDGPVAILLHGWPYDIHSFGEVTPGLPLPGFRLSFRTGAVTGPRVFCRTKLQG